MSSSAARAHTPGEIPAWTFADKIRKARETTGLGQVEFAEEVQLSASTLAAYEKGRTKPRFGDVESLAKRIQVRTGIPYAWFLIEDEPQPPTLNRRAADYRVAGSAPVVDLASRRQTA